MHCNVVMVRLIEFRFDFN